ncbi:fatty acid desaturase [Solirubrobacter sp. CPCC 204708]|uniref:Fatty acid desaturase n=1 Tax=Solirubrobacter deserti TaxID=2282478 RepID=A0ABT4RPJ8_9ACTN|nr:fatty acid desaturase [Solirubrobacter deserti]MBE2319959.1 fatty acid desaturase [Solirubrobacter deserti]MDA0140447.1 fatty acid desaturase [Solirubrobacter deserti]
MTRLERRVNMAAVFIPFIVTAVAIAVLWGDWIGWSDVVVFGIMYVLSGLGVTVGFHRMLTHRAFQTHNFTRYFFAYLGMLSVQGPVIDWVADHRKHHAHTDVEGDPHSPHVGHGDGLSGALKGLWHSHVGWLWETHGEASARKYAKDLVEDRTMRILNRKFPLIVVGSLLIPTILGGLLSWSLKGAFTGLIWGGFVRIFLQHHVTWSVNSVCHFFGRRRFDIEDKSTNVFWLAIPSFGESWHHNHHAFPRSAAHGLKWWEIDPSQMVINLMKRLGLAWDVVTITPERQAQKLIGAEKPVKKKKPAESDEKVAEPVA